MQKLIGLLLLLPVSAFADSVTFQYTGQPFSALSGPPLFSTADRVTATVTLEPGENVQALSLTLTVGTITITSNATQNLFTTHGNGTIDEWLLYAQLPGFSAIRISNYGDAAVREIGAVTAVASNDVGGRWQRQPARPPQALTLQVATVPEPSTWVLVIVGLLPLLASRVYPLNPLKR